MRGRLNLFQASMLRWREVHPYNGVHVMRIGKALAPPALQQAIDDVLVGQGLTGLVLDAARRRFDYTGGPASAPLRVLAPAADPDEALRAQIESELNAAFPREGRIEPFRFFAVERADGFDLGLGYDHFVAAGDSIVALLKAIALRYVDGSAVAAPRVAPADAPTYGRMFLRQAWPLVAGLRRIPGSVAGLRRAFRPRYPHGRAQDVGFVRFRIGREHAEAMRRRARAWGATQNDLLLAMLLATLSPLTEERHRQRRRRQIAVASIVNLRADCGPAAQDVFGQFLSSFHVVHPVPPGTGLEALARHVGAETARIKREKLYLHTPIAMAIGGLLWRFQSPAQRARLHAKAYPLWAGMTPLNAEALWRAVPGDLPTPAYVRAAPTGPFAPLGLAVTAAGGVLEVGLTFRTAAFTRAETDKIAATLLDHVQRLC